MIKKIQLDHFYAILKYFSIVFTAFVIFSGVYYKSFWMDDLSTIYYAHIVPYRAFLLHWADKTNPPLFYIFFKWYMTFAGNTEFLLRLPSICFSMGTLYLTSVLSVDLDQKESKWVSLMLLVVVCFWDPFLYFSNEIRSYALELLLVFLYLKWFYKLYCGKRSILYVVLLGITGLLCSLTHYYGALFVATMILAGFISREIKSKHIFWSHFPLISVGIIFSFKLISAFSAKSAFWIEPISFEMILNEISYSFSEKSYWITLLIFAPIFGSVFRTVYKMIRAKQVSKEERFVLISLSAYLFMVLIIVVKSILGTPILFRRYLAILLPLIIINIPCSLKNIFNQFRFDKVVSVYLSVFVIFSFMFADYQFLYSNISTNDIKGAINYVRSVQRYEDYILSKRSFYAVAYNPEFYNYYFEREGVQNITKIRTFDYMSKTDEEFLAPFGDLKNKKLILVYEKEYLERLLINLKGREVFTKDFRGVSVILVN